MRKMTAILFSFLLTVLISISTINLAQATISSYNWIASIYRGYDEFYGSHVVAYEAGSNAILAVSVYSDYYVGYPYYDYRPVNVSAVKVGFDWGRNYTSTEASEANPVQIEPYQSRVFTVDVNVPETIVASNLVTHTYTIYVEHVNSTTGAKEIVDTWTESGYPNFAVYTEDQADAQESYQELDALRYMTPLFITSEARIAWTQHQIEKSIGSTYYRRGDFTNAKTHYQTALDLVNQSFSAEATRGTGLEDALTNFMNKAGEASGTQSQAFMILSVGVSVGIILIGVGVIIYATAKRKMALVAAAQASSAQE